MNSTQHQESWNKGKLVGQKPPLKPKDRYLGIEVDEALEISEQTEI